MTCWKSTWNQKHYFTHSASTNQTTEQLHYPFNDSIILRIPTCMYLCTLTVLHNESSEFVVSCARCFPYKKRKLISSLVWFSGTVITFTCKPQDKILSHHVCVHALLTLCSNIISAFCQNTHKVFSPVSEIGWKGNNHKLAGVWNERPQVLFALSGGWSCRSHQVKQVACCPVIKPFTQTWGCIDSVRVVKTSALRATHIYNCNRRGTINIKLRNLCVCVLKK